MVRDFIQDLLRTKTMLSVNMLQQNHVMLHVKTIIIWYQNHNNMVLKP